MDFTAARHPVRPIDTPRALDGLTRGLPTLMAVAGTAITFALVDAFAPRDGRLATLLLERGWTQPITLGLFFWGLGHVVRRALVHGVERRAVRACAEQLWDERLAPVNLPGLVASLQRHRATLAGQVLLGIVSFFRGHRPARDEVMKVARHEMDRAYDRVEGDYRALSACMWLMPLSGFLGTVIGMATAIGSFDMVVTALGDDLGALAPAVNGLATAFDTTLLALALVVPLKLLEVGLEDRDRRLLEQIDQTFATGWVRTINLAGLAQQSPVEEALERQAAAMARLEQNLLRVDAALEKVVSQAQRAPHVLAALAEVAGAARVTRDHLPDMARELEALRAQNDRPLRLVRERDA